MSISLFFLSGLGRMSWASLAGGLGVCRVWVADSFFQGRIPTSGNGSDTLVSVRYEGKPATD